MLVNCGEDREPVEGLLFELLRVEVAATLNVRILSSHNQSISLDSYV